MNYYFFAFFLIQGPYIHQRNGLSYDFNAFLLLFFLLQAMVEKNCVGAIVCKLDMHKKMFRRGYIAMLAVDSKFRRKGIGMCVFCIVQFSIVILGVFQMAICFLLCSVARFNWIPSSSAVVLWFIHGKWSKIVIYHGKL